MKMGEIRKLKRIVKSMNISTKEAEIASAIRYIFSVDIEEGFKMLDEARNK